MLKVNITLKLHSTNRCKVIIYIDISNRMGQKVCSEALGPMKVGYG